MNVDQNRMLSLTVKVLFSYSHFQNLRENVYDYDYFWNLISLISSITITSENHVVLDYSITITSENYVALDYSITITSKKSSQPIWPSLVSPTPSTRY